jgi:site-specific recombinase XerD
LYLFWYDLCIFPSFMLFYFWHKALNWRGDRTMGVMSAHGSTEPLDPFTRLACGLAAVTRAAADLLLDVQAEVQAGFRFHALISELGRKYGPWSRPVAHALIETELSESTVRQYIRHVAHFLTWMAEHGHQEPTVHVVENYMDWLKNSGRSGARSVALCAIRAVYEWSDEDHEAVSAGVRHPRKPAPRSPLPPQHVASIANVAATLREKLAVVLANQFGMRVSALVQLTVGDLHFSDGLLFVKAPVLPENKQGVRLNAELAVEFAATLGDRARDEWLFPSPSRSGSHLSSRAMYYLFARLRKRAGLREGMCTCTTIRKATCLSVIALDTGTKPALRGCLHLVGLGPHYGPPAKPAESATARQAGQIPLQTAIGGY